MNKKSIVIIELGGTICSTVHHPTSEFYNGPDNSIRSFIKDLDLDREINLEIIPFSRKISHELTIDEILLLGREIQRIIELVSCDGLVVVMGTNALEDIAYFMGLVINSKKPIVFTGAHFPQNSLNFDGKKNLYSAILVASSQKANELGILVTFNDCVVTARDATKSNPGLINNFSIDGNGVIGYVIGKEFYLKARPTYKHTYQSDFSIERIKSLPRVTLIYAHIGIDDIFIKASVSSGVKGIISAGYGKGYQSQNITEALHEAVTQGVVVVRCARLGHGYTNIDHSYDEKNRFIVANELSPHKSSLLLSVALNLTMDRSRIQDFFKEY